MSLELLRRLTDSGAIRPIDYHFARSIAVRAEAETDAIALGAAMLSIELGRGNVCVELGDADSQLPARRQPFVPALIDGARLREALLSERGVCAATEDNAPRPLVLDGNRLYLHRYWQSECRVATRLREMASSASELGAGSRALLDRLFPDAPGHNEQKRACELAATRALAVITGGPGTGKTTTVARLLLLLAAGGQRISMQLAAPTGKAAARVSDALDRELRGLSGGGLLDEGILRALPRDAKTLHRLLGAGSDGRFRVHRDNPLAADVVVVDESSMVDLRLLDALLQALPRTARLVLLGDRDQLAAVEAGSVFGALCATRGQGQVRESLAVLSHSFRFGAVSAIGRLAAAVNASDIAGVEALLAGDGTEPLAERYAEHFGATHQCYLLDRFRPLIDAARGNAEPETLLCLLDAFRVLTPLREGEFGVAGLNRLVQRSLLDAGLIDDGEEWFPGRPILITRNDHGLQLYNGDVGVVTRGEDQRPRVLFRQPGTGVRSLPVARLPEHESAFAMTVHKSQGSEFDAVLLVLPPTRDNAVAPGGRELVYTAVTRARHAVSIWLPQGPLDARWLQKSEPRSGLADRLRRE